MTDGALCVRCHAKLATVVGTKHDLRPKAGAVPPAAVEAVAGSSKPVGVCLTCHSVHEVRPAIAGRPGSLDPAGKCIQCHRPGGAAEKLADVSFAHPARFIWPPPSERLVTPDGAPVPPVTTAPDRPRLLRSMPTKLTLFADPQNPARESKSFACLSCHDPHASSRKLFMRSVPDELCSQCHADQASRLSGKHDFRDRPELKNRADRAAADTGRCGFCHSVHRGNSGSPDAGPVLIAATAQPIKSADDLCVQCHRVGGLAAKTPATPYRHPTGRTAAAQTNADLRATTLPLFDSSGRRSSGAAASVACASCHDVHGDGRGNPKLVRTDKANWELCVNCHPGQVMLVGGSHDATRAGARSWPAGTNKDLCFSCHTPHGKDADRKLWTVKPVASAGPDDGACLGCHPKQGWIASNGTFAVGAALHPRAVPTNRQPRGLPLVTTAPDGPIDHIGCRTCHNPHAGAKANRLLRTSEGLATSAVCLGCHPDARQTENTMHAPRTVSKADEKTLEALPVCGPCHAVHAVKGSDRDMLWAAGQGEKGPQPQPQVGPRGAQVPVEPEGIRPSEKRCLTCHGQSGTAAKPAAPKHQPVPAGLVTDIGLKSVHEDAKGTTTLTCVICHTPHGYTFRAAVAEPAKPTDRQYATKPLLRSGVARDFCASCHGYEGLRRFLYYHQRSKWARLRF